MSTVETITENINIPGLTLRPGPDAETKEKDNKEAYRYEHLLPHFSQDHYDPLSPYEHVDPGSRALAHSNPRTFLVNATKVTDLTPKLGTEVEGVSLEKLDSTGRDQLALEVIAHFFRILFKPSLK